jgi:hypothetical protein
MKYNLLIIVSFALQLTPLPAWSVNLASEGINNKCLNQSNGELETNSSCRINHFYLVIVTTTTSSTSTAPSTTSITSTTTADTTNTVTSTTTADTTNTVTSTTTATAPTTVSTTTTGFQSLNSTTTIQTCSSINKFLCNKSNTIPKRNQGQTFNITAGDARSKTFVCNNSTWQVQLDEGHCCLGESTELCGVNKTVPKAVNTGDKKKVTAGYSREETFRCDSASNSFVSEKVSGNCNEPTSTTTAKSCKYVHKGAELCRDTFFTRDCLPADDTCPGSANPNGVSCDCNIAQKQCRFVRSTLVYYDHYRCE